MWSVASIAFILLQGLLEGVTIPGPSTQSNNIEALRHQVSNQEIEMRCFEHKLENLQTILESLRDQLNQATASHQDQLKNSSLENLYRGLTADMQQLKAHANETTTLLQTYRKTLLEYEQRFKVQSQNIENLTAALQTVLDGYQGVEAGEKLYKIKSGDRLDKIAKAHGTTVKELMRINQLNSPDKIVEGKTIKVFE